MQNPVEYARFNDGSWALAFFACRMADDGDAWFESQAPGYVAEAACGLWPWTAIDGMREAVTDV